MRIDRGLLDKIRSRGEEVLTQLSAELSTNPRFARAMEGALRGKDRLEHVAAVALEQVNVPTRGELKRATARIETLERELAELRKELKARRSAAKGASAARQQGSARGKPARRRAARGGVSKAG
jgi:hypothetical protein